MNPEQVAQFFASLPKEVVTAIIAMIPILELRGAIPWALASPPIGGGLSWQSAYVSAVIGNFIPVIPILLFLEPVSNGLRKYRLFDRFFEWLFRRTRKKGRLIEKFELLGLMLFVGIPLPVTGAWTGAVAAFIFGVRFMPAVMAIFAGICLAGIIVTLASLGVISLF
jgi:uncharacterized membrane protein